MTLWGNRFFYHKKKFPQEFILIHRNSAELTLPLAAANHFLPASRQSGRVEANLGKEGQQLGG